MRSTAGYLYKREFLRDAGFILSSLVKRFPHSAYTPQALLILSRIARIEGHLNRSVSLLSRVIKEYSGSDERYLAMFKKGLIYYEMKDSKEAVSAFTDYLRNATRDNEARALWWLGRCYHLLGNMDMGDKYFNRLRRKFPLSFYSVVQNSYNHIKRLTYGEAFSDLPQSSSFYAALRLEENLHFIRAACFIRMGLIDYAQHELSYISYDNPVTNHVLALILSKNGLYRASISRAASAAVTDPEQIGNSLINILFPQVYLKDIIRKSSLFGMDHILILSLIKQESAFDRKAVSRSGALGLMQLMPFTADEVSSRLYLKPDVENSHLSDPHVNISIATYYFYKILSRLKGDVVYSLASYNAGPSRAFEWKQQNRGLSTMEIIENIPVGETNLYVKNILRNYVFYKYLLDKRTLPFEKLIKGTFSESVLIKP
jgi:soluble lytic murein transglycosylase